MRYFEEWEHDYHPFLKQEKSYISLFDERMPGKTCLRRLKQEVGASLRSIVTVLQIASCLVIFVFPN